MRDVEARRKGGGEVRGREGKNVMMMFLFFVGDYTHELWSQSPNPEFLDQVATIVTKLLNIQKKFYGDNVVVCSLLHNQDLKYKTFKLVQDILVLSDRPVSKTEPRTAALFFTCYTV